MGDSCQRIFKNFFLHEKRTSVRFSFVFAKALLTAVLHPVLFHNKICIDKCFVYTVSPCNPDCMLKQASCIPALESVPV